MVVGWGQVWTIWRVRQQFPSQFLDFVLNDFRNVRASVVLEKPCPGRVYALALQCLVHTAQLLCIQFCCHCLAGFQHFEMHQLFAIPPYAEHHLIAMEIRLWGRFCLLTAAQPLPFSACVIKANPLFIGRHNGVEKSTRLGAPKQNSRVGNACRFVVIGEVMWDPSTASIRFADCVQMIFNG